MEVKVRDLEGNERGFEYAEAKYGVAFRRAEVAIGEKVYRLVELWEKTGHHSLITQVLDEDGQPIDEMDVAFYWIDAPFPPDPPTGSSEYDWYGNFVHGVTNIGGNVGPGMGTGAYHGTGEGGPHAVWVRDPLYPSDICEKLGMLAGTFHDHLDQKFQLMTEGGQPVPIAGKFVETYREYQDNVEGNHIAIKVPNESARNFYDTRVHLVVGDDPANPDWEAPEPIYPVGLNHYNIGAEYTPTPGETSRFFWITIQDPQGEALSDPIGFAFQTSTRRYHRIDVEWQEEGEPPPPPPPPPPTDDNLAEIFMAMAVAHSAMADLCRRCADLFGGLRSRWSE